MSCKNLLEIQQLSNLKQTYLITVAILEGRYYVWPNMDSVVIVRALGKTEKTDVVKNSDCPFYNEFFTFDKKIALYDLLNSEIVVTVVQPGSIFRKRKILGLFRLDVATIWAEPEHQFHNKWAVLNSPTNNKSGDSGSRGFLKVNLSVITKNVSSAIPPIKEDNEIEGNLLLPHSRVTERFNAKFMFDIFRAEHLYDKKKPPSSHVVVAFAGNTAKTSVRKNTSFPVFNERIVIHDMYPVLCQRFHIKIYFGSTLYASDFLPLHYVTSEEEDGFLPKFGPAFLHMYESTGKERYKGSILFSMRTKLEAVSAEDKRKSEVIPISSSSEGVHPPPLDLKFFAIIFESSALDKRFEGKITYKATIGNMDVGDKKINPFVKNISDQIEVKKINKNSYFSVIKENKPLLTFGINVVDYRKRLYNMNMLEKIYEAMDKKLYNIGFLFDEGDITLNQKISDELLLCLDTFRTSTRKYIDIAGNYDLSGLTALGRGKLEENLKLMKYLIEKTENIFNPNALRRTFVKMKKLSDRVLCIFNNINDMWPDIFITVWKGNEELAYVRVPCKDVLHSQIEEEKGKMCGSVMTLYLQPEKKKIPRAKFFTNSVGKIEALLWLGTDNYYDGFLKNLPGSFEMNEQLKTSPYLYVAAKEEHVFQCRCHLFQGRIRPGNDSSALSDTIVRIHFFDDCQESTIETETLNPVWNQTLIFKKLTYYGSSDFIKENPPSIIIELWDRDKFFFWEFIGRTSVKPLVKTREEPYSPPRFPPKLQWFRVFDGDSISAKILAAFEMLEITGDTDECNNDVEKDIIRIPDDIKPALVSYRMEIYFWGLRNLKIAMKRPKIVIEYLKSLLHSDPLMHNNGDNNFANPIKNIDVQLPSVVEYASPIIIRMTDTRCWSTSPIGIYIKNVKLFLENELTEQDRQNILGSVALHESMAEVNEDNSSEDSQLNLKETKPHMVFKPKNCFCRTSELQKLPKKISQIRCVCKKTRWQKFRQTFNKKQIFCPCLKEYQKNVEKVEKKHGTTCPCCRRILEKLRFISSEENNRPGFWSSFFGAFKSSCFGGKCECCQKISEKMKWICQNTVGKCIFCERIIQRFSGKKDKNGGSNCDDSYDDNDYDWWTKFHSSLKPIPKQTARVSVRDKFRLKIYRRELESQPEFKRFTDVLMAFPMYKGKRTGDELVDREMVQGVFKGNIKIYRWPEPPGKHLITSCSHHYLIPTQIFLHQFHYWWSKTGQILHSSNALLNHVSFHL